MAAWLALLVLLFGQVCVAAHACPVVLPAVATASAMPPGCDGEGAPQPDAACETHCQGASASVPAAQTPTAILDAAPLIVVLSEVVAPTSRDGGGTASYHSLLPIPDLILPRS
jgi:hypothetical protein